MSSVNGPHQNQPLIGAGRELAQATVAMILVHGRGASPQDILALGTVLNDGRFAMLAPSAAGRTWYPNSFLAPVAANEPGISSGLQAIGEALAVLAEAGISAEKTVLAGFSQGACLTSEYVARHPQRYGGLLAFSGGVIGPLDMVRHDEGDLDQTPIFLGCSDVDFHIPEQKVHLSAEIFTKMNGSVTKKIYPNMGHTIIQDEIDEARRILTLV